MNPRVLTTTIASLFAAVSLHAQTWDGGGANDSLATAANWNPDGIPGTAADVIFGGAVRLTPVVPSAFVFNSLTFNNTAGAFVFGGVGVLSINVGGITNNDATTQTFTNAVNFGISAASQINAASGSLIFGGTVATAASTLTLNGANAISFNGPIGGAGTIVKSGTGALNVSATATAIGADFSLNAGTTTLLATGAVQTFSSGSALAVNGTATLAINESTALDGAQLTKASGATVTFAAGETLTIQNAGSASFTGTQNFSNAGTINVLSGGELSSTGGMSIGAGGAATVNLNVSGAGSSLGIGSFSDWGGFSGTTLATFSDGATGTLSGGLRLGQFSSAASSATVNVQTGAQMSIGSSLVIGPSATGAASSLTIDGAGSQVTLTGPSFFVLGATSGNTHSLAIQNGGVFTSGTGALTVSATGAVNLGGTGSVFNANGNMNVNGLLARTSGGTFNLAAGKTLTMQGGGDFTNSTTYSHTSASTVTVTGAGSTLTASATNQLRFSGGSTLNVLAGGQATAGGALFLAAGGDAGNTTVLVDGAGSTLTGGTNSVFAANGNTATVTFSNGAAGSFGTGLQFANTNTIGTSADVNVLTGATLAAGSLTMGNVSSGTAVSALLTIDGAGSAATVAGNVTIGSGSVNTARLTIDHDGTFTHGGTFSLSPTGRVFLTDGTFNANGYVTVNGGIFTVEANGDFNLAANRTLTVSGGGNAEFVDILRLVTPASALSVQGSGSFVTGNRLHALSSNSVFVSAGGDISFNQILLGSNLVANAVVTGGGSSMSGISLGLGNATATFSAGSSGVFGAVELDGDVFGLAGTTASLRVESGATVTATSTSLADTGSLGAGNTSVLTVTGSGSTYTQAGSATLAVGSSIVGPGISTGTINVRDGGTYTSGTGSIALRTTGTINVDGGTLDLKGTLIRDGGALNFNTGELRIIDSWTVGAGGLLGADVAFNASRRMVTTANTIIDPFHTLTLNGGTLSTAALLNNGALAFNSGTLAITGAGGFNIGTGALGANVTLGTGATMQVSQTTTINAGALLRLNGGVFTSANVTNNGTLDQQDGTLNITGTLNNAAGSRLFVGGLSFDSSNVTNVGRITLLNGLGEIGGTGTITNTGVITGDGAIGKAVTNSASGQIRAEAGKTLLLTGTVAANAGTFSLEGGTLEFTNAITNGATGTITGFGALRSALLTNNGNIGLSGDARFYGDVTNASGARIITSGGATTTFFDDVVHNGTEIRTSAGSSSVFFGAVSGAGPFTGTGTVYFEGDLRPGNSPASVLYEGDLVFGGGASLTLEIGGLLSGLQHDHLNVGGALHADGDLVLALLDGFTPQFGDTFDLLDVGAFTGDFDSITAPALAGGNAWDFSNLKTTGSITVVPEPGVAALLLCALGLLGARRNRLAASSR